MNTRNILALVVAGLFVVTATTAPAGEKANPNTNSYINFSSPLVFRVKPQVQSWNGTVQWSIDAKHWFNYTSGDMEAGPDGLGSYLLYVRGTGNSRITGFDQPGWIINGKGPIVCSGNLETMLDYTTVANGGHPLMDTYCFANLFQNCTNLSSAPLLLAANLTNSCCSSMFSGCTRLTNAPVLPSTNLANQCYYNMFSDCSSLTIAPELPATTLALGCYAFMFNHCSSLKKAPTLPATTLAPACYRQMFSFCDSLTNVPTLPATTLASLCYQHMFHFCSGLTELPALPATNLAENCYYEMFKACTGIKVYTAGPGTPWSIPSGATPATNWNYRMFNGTSGDFRDDPEIGTTYYYVSSELFPAPSAYLTFSSTNTFTVTPPTNSWDGTLYCSTDATNWSSFTTNGATATNNGAGEYKLYLCGASNTYITGFDSLFNSGLTITGAGSVACSGNIETLLDYATVADGGHPVMTEYCFLNLFKNCKALVSAPALPAMTLTNSCYLSMFSGCTSLTSAPALPATNLAVSCYRHMFADCTSLTSAPALPASNLTSFCYNYMFISCSGLKQAPTLPATTLATSCYDGMFNSCTSLTNAPELPAVNLAEKCYQGMFNACTGLKQAPVLPATALATSCYGHMFYSCTGLTEAPALPATTLTNSCYNYMFAGCTGLTRLPVLPATNLAANCYNSMFYGCTGIKLNTEGPGPEWGIPAGAVEADNWNADMLLDTGGTFTNDPVIGTTYYYVPSAPAAPSGVSASDGTFTNKIRITWNAVNFATGYQLWRHTADNSAAATEIGSTTGTTYDDTTTVAKTTYYYWVKATNAAGVSGFSASDSGWRDEPKPPKPPKPAAPTGVGASDGVYTDKVRVTWKASAGATSYVIYRHTINKPSAAARLGTSATTSYDDKTAKTELTYYYWVKALNESGASGFSAFDTGYPGVVGPLIMVNGMVGNNIRVSANKPITVAATMMNLPRAYFGVPVDWWVAAYVHQGGLWFYFDTNFNLVQFDGNLANVRPAYQGALYNVPPLTLVENMLLPRGTYNIWFAVDYPMDGRIDLNGTVLLSTTTIVVE
ncbi:MAG: fibronectin type III domain-containing protein [Kiritimatiellia bacterium]|jgi:hypothetical protein